MTSKNDITGDLIQTKVFSKKDKKGWKDVPEPVKVDGPMVPNGLAKHWERNKKK